MLTQNLYARYASTAFQYSFLVISGAWTEAVVPPGGSARSRPPRCSR
jgi:hypothetical protein